MCALFAGAHLARIGTPLARITTGSLLLGSIALFFVRWWKERRDWFDPRRTLERTLLPADKKLGERALRALSLVQRTHREDGAGSKELAQVHFERLLARASVDAVAEAADRRATTFRRISLALVLAAFAALAVGPPRVLEGIDVLLARGGRAPVPMPWLDALRVTAQPPSYLRQSDRHLFPSIPARLPAGTLLSIHGVPLRDGRQLVLTDGDGEVPFVSDGRGGVVARWTVERDAELVVAARFGKVLIEEPDKVTVENQPDELPVVTLEGAPKTLKLADVSRVELRYEALDDHGLRQVDLVLRSGGREERRTLAKLDGNKTSERGGHALTPRDPFLRRMFLPVVVTVEARDDDPVGGPKWGVSEAITLIPPAVGEPEANRYAALLGARNLTTDFLAWQMLEKGELAAKDRSMEERRRAERVADAMQNAVDDVYGGLTVPDGLRAFLLGQMRILTRAPRPGESVQRKTEEVVLGVDVALSTVATHDAQSVAKRLGDVAEEAAAGAEQARESEKRKLGLTRLDSAIAALDEGAERLGTLGALGRDLGSVTLADLGRVKRARKSEDLFHAELAARHLAARLRRPTPSFGSAQRGGVESGTPGQNGAHGGSPSQASERFDQLASELEQLVQEHASEIDQVEQALGEAEQGVDLDSLKDEARERADAIRRSLGGLPQTGADPGSGRAAAALGKEHAGSMAQSLERLSLSDAVQSGKDALSALEDAERKAKSPRSPSDWVDEEDLSRSREEVKRQLGWAQEQLDKLKRQAEAKAKAQLEKSGEREQGHSRRAGNLAARGKNGETALPQDALEALERAEGLMRQAARALSEGKGEKGLSLQREAQRQLERSNNGKTTDTESDRPEPSSGKESGNGGIRTGGDVPKKDDGKRAEEFRRRVLRGLGKAKDGRLAPAVRRYAEGLLE